MSDPASSSLTRRSLLETLPNPGQRLDYVITLSRSLALSVRADSASLKLRYIPDRRILDPSAITPYMQSMENATWESLEALAQNLLEDINNELVPRWLEITLHQVTGAQTPAAIDYAVIIEDRQPGWSNPQLLGRLRPWAEV